MKTLTKYALGCAVAVTAIYGAIKSNEYQKPPDYVELMSTVVKVQGKNGHGSGVLIAPGLILTNRHVADTPGDKTIKFKDGTERPAKVVAKSEGSDWAVMKMDDPVDSDPAKIDCREPEFGERVTAMGNPMRLEWVISDGVVSSMFDAKKVKLYVFDADIGPGSSGGPVFDDDGELIGLSTAVFPAVVGFGQSSLMGLSGFTSIHDFCSLYE
ncbi:MAG: putative peptidase/serine protease [Prokaryotic dsDNA virus sp.]|nr:MAG: putative peptidase/serine protease [Prokaryotic dsDNA virus sp.]|tara:strand:- start:17251 stop:17886 length:636 start_codon:yes stop_codon:yes gene_type:complete